MSRMSRANQGAVLDAAEVKPVGWDPPPRKGMNDDDITGLVSFIVCKQKS